MPTPPRPLVLRLLPLLLVPLLGIICVSGVLWSGTTLPETSRNLFGSVLVADIVRPTIYGLALLLPSLLLIARLRNPTVAFWRGVTLMFAVGAGHALLLGYTLALDRFLPYPGVPDVLPPFITLLYTLVVLFIGRGYFSRRMSLTQVALGAGIGGVIAAGWVAAGALGTLSELGLALLEAVANSALAAVLITLVFFYGHEQVSRRPIPAALMAGISFAVLSPSLLAVRGWSTQGIGLALAMLFYSIVAGLLLVMDKPPQLRRAWWGVWAFLFMALLLPLAFTDRTEGEWVPGGLPTATATAGIVGVLLSAGVASLLMVGRRWRGQGVWHPAVAVVLFGAALVLIGGLFSASRQGLQPDTFFVVMAEQANTQSAEGISNRTERLSVVYTLLTTHATATQADLRATLDAQGVRYTPYYLVNGLEVEGNPLLRETLAQRPDVARILDSPHFRPQPPLVGPIQLAEAVDAEVGIAEGVHQIRADAVWHDFQVTGNGIVVGASGNGVDWKHPDLQPQYLGGEDNHDYTWFDPWEGTTQPTDTNTIGTHTLGTVLGRNGIGVAPDAQWIACRSLARDFGNIPYYLDCMQFLLAPFPQSGDPFTDGDPTRGVHIVNAAFTCPPWEGCDTETLSVAITHLANAGQFVVTGAGNDGPDCGTVGVPGVAADALTVGAVDDTGTIAPFSSRGPVTIDGSGHTKPDVMAPGVAIYSAMPDGRYAEMGGTSMATSHVAGVVALVWSARPALIGDREGTTAILTATAHPAPSDTLCGASSNNGYGMVDAYEAVKMALELP